MIMQQTIETKLNKKLKISHLEVINESHQHNVPAGSESHFKLIIVSIDFTGKSLLARHRMINQILATELAGSIHALSMHTYTLEQWQEKGFESPHSPKCLGGKKKEDL